MRKIQILAAGDSRKLSIGGLEKMRNEKKLSRGMKVDNYSEIRDFK